MAKIKMTPERIRNIYKFIEQGDTQEHIARRYNVSRAHISKIGLGMSENPPAHARWAWVWQELNNIQEGGK